MFNREMGAHSHSMEMREGSQPYLKHRASRNALLCRVNPNSATERAVNQLEAPSPELVPWSVGGCWKVIV